MIHEYSQTGNAKSCIDTTATVILATKQLRVKTRKRMCINKYVNGDATEKSVCGIDRLY